MTYYDKGVVVPYPSDRRRVAEYTRLANLRKEAEAHEEKERLARIKYVARLGSGRPVLKAATFTELGDILTKEGYKMKKARAAAKPLAGVVVPHEDSDRPPAVVERRVE